MATIAPSRLLPVPVEVVRDSLTVRTVWFRSSASMLRRLLEKPPTSSVVETDMKMNKAGGSSEMGRGPMWEPKDSNFRPYGITTLIFFYIGKFFGRLFRRR